MSPIVFFSDSDGQANPITTKDHGLPKQSNGPSCRHDLVTLSLGEHEFGDSRRYGTLTANRFAKHSGILKSR